MSENEDISSNHTNSADLGPCVDSKPEQFTAKENTLIQPKLVVKQLNTSIAEEEELDIRLFQMTEPQPAPPNELEDSDAPSNILDDESGSDRSFSAIAEEFRSDIITAAAPRPPGLKGDS